MGTRQCISAGHTQIETHQSNRIRDWGEAGRKVNKGKAAVGACSSGGAEPLPVEGRTPCFPDPRLVFCRMVHCCLPRGLHLVSGPRGVGLVTANPAVRAHVKECLVRPSACAGSAGRWGGTRGSPGLRGGLVEH